MHHNCQGSARQLQVQKEEKAPVDCGSSVIISPTTMTLYWYIESVIGPCTKVTETPFSPWRLGRCARRQGRRETEGGARDGTMAGLISRLACRMSWTQSRPFRVWRDSSHDYCKYVTRQVPGFLLLPRGNVTQQGAWS